MGAQKRDTRTWLLGYTDGCAEEGGRRFIRTASVAELDTAWSCSSTPTQLGCCVAGRDMVLLSCMMDVLASACCRPDDGGGGAEPAASMRGPTWRRGFNR
jgi:hypothetical protein